MKLSDMQPISFQHAGFHSLKEM